MSTKTKTEKPKTEYDGYIRAYDEHKHLHPTFQEVPDLAPGLAKVAYSTVNAYSYYAYGPISWGQIVQHMSDEGMTAREIEEILRSKHMRWCNDNSKRDTEKGIYTVTLDDFKAYVKRIGGIKSLQADVARWDRAGDSVTLQKKAS